MSEKKKDNLTELSETESEKTEVEAEAETEVEETAAETESAAEEEKEEVKVEFEEEKKTEEDKNSVEAEEAEKAEENQESKIYFENIGSGETAEAQKLKEEKKFKIQTPILIGSFVLGVAIVAFIAWYIVSGILNPSIVGTWRMIDPEAEPTTVSADASEDEVPAIDMYFIFESDGRLRQIQGNVEYYGEYEIETVDNVTKVTIIQYGGEAVTLEAVIEGNMFTGKTLKLILETGNEIDFVSDNYKEYRDRIENPKINDEIVGVWSDSEYGWEVEITDDGLIRYCQKTQLNETVASLWLAYSIVDDTKMTVKNLGEESEQEYLYDEENDKLILFLTGSVGLSRGELTYETVEEDVETN